jgi:hypothetical protein
VRLFDSRRCITGKRDTWKQDGERSVKQTTTIHG